MTPATLVVTGLGDDKLLNCWLKECSDETLSISQKTHL